MTIDSPLDPRHARLVALLYDELPPEEERALRAELARDAALRQEWDELNAARGFLSAWEIEERTPSFVFVEPPAGAPGTAAPDAAGRPGAPLTLVRGARRALAWSGWGVAAAALLFVALAGNGARVERLDNGFAFRFNNAGPRQAGSRGGDSALAGAGAAADSPSLALLNRSPRERLGLSGGTPISLTGVGPADPGGETFVTPADLSAHQDQMVNMVVRMLNEERARQDREWTSMLRSVYSDLNDRQFTGYRDLRGRIEAVNVGLMLGRSGAGTKPDGTTITVPADTLKFKTRPRQPNGRNWKYGDFADEPERF